MWSWHWRKWRKSCHNILGFYYFVLFFFFLLKLIITAFHILFWSDPIKCFSYTQTNSYCKSKIQIIRLRFLSLNIWVLNAKTSWSFTYWFYRHAVSSCADMRNLTFHPPLPGRQEYGCVSVYSAAVLMSAGWIVQRRRVTAEHSRFRSASQLAASSIETARVSLVAMRRFHMKLYGCFKNKTNGFYC